MTAPDRITVWACVEDGCDYWRPDKSTGVHMQESKATNYGTMEKHALAPVEYVRAQEDEKA